MGYVVLTGRMLTPLSSKFPSLPQNPFSLLLKWDQRESQPVMVQLSK